MRPRIGVITTGQGPRVEYEEFHQSLFATMGADVTIISRHVLDNVDADEIKNFGPASGAPAIHANIRGSNTDFSTLGRGWRNVWVDRSIYVERVQLALDSLRAENVNVAIICVAEELPVESLYFDGPLVVPFTHLKNAVESAVRFRRGAKVAMFAYGSRQRDQQTVAWSREAWMNQVEFSYFELDQGWSSAAASASDFGADCGVIMGYGAGLLGDEDGLLELRDELKVPVLVPHMIATTAARQYALPEQNPRQFLSLASQL
jgi:protein AroM